MRGNKYTKHQVICHEVLCIVVCAVFGRAVGSPVSLSLLVLTVLHCGIITIAMDLSVGDIIDLP